jgi:hypothetical protein
MDCVLLGATHLNIMSRQRPQTNRIDRDRDILTYIITKCDQKKKFVPEFMGQILLSGKQGCDQDGHPTMTLNS